MRPPRRAARARATGAGVRWALIALAALLTLSACSTSTEITAGKLQRSLGPTFANLYVRQQIRRGDPHPPPDALAAKARCRKGNPDDPQQGAGNDWICYIRFRVDGPGTPVTATYTVTVQTDGCYAADGDGPTTLNGRRTITGRGYRQVLNPLYLINGCFDVG